MNTVIAMCSIKEQNKQQNKGVFDAITLTLGVLCLFSCSVNQSRFESKRSIEYNALNDSISFISDTLASRVLKYAQRELIDSCEDGRAGNSIEVRVLPFLLFDHDRVAVNPCENERPFHSAVYTLPDTIPFDKIGSTYLLRDQGRDSIVALAYVALDGCRHFQLGIYPEYVLDLSNSYNNVRSVVRRNTQFIDRMRRDGAHPFLLKGLATSADIYAYKSGHFVGYDHVGAKPKNLIYFYKQQFGCS